MTILSKTDRCDACPAEAKQIAIIPGIGEFLFCDHHLRRHSLALSERNAVVINGHAPEDTQEIPKAEMDELLKPKGRQMFYPNQPGVSGVPWYEVAEGRYTNGTSRADAEDRFRRLGAGSTREILEAQFPTGVWKDEGPAEALPRVFHTPAHPMPFFEVQPDKFVYARDRVDADVRFGSGATTFTAAALRQLHPDGHFE